MPKHPSLFAPKIDLNRHATIPVMSMNPYEPCWCKSGKKYKWCHFRRHKKVAPSIFELENKMMSLLKEGYCSYPFASPENPCSTTITKAHTVQKKGGLSAISENNHVLTVKPAIKDMIATGGNPPPRSIGINNASVFPGFCSNHDSSIFKPIEGKSLDLNLETAFLFSYRAIAYESFLKKQERERLSILRESDCGKPFEIQAGIQSHINDVLLGVDIGDRELQVSKGEYDRILHSADYSTFNFVSIRFDSVLPIVACGAFHPEFTMAGEPLQQLAQNKIQLDQITITVTAFENNTIVVFGWIGPNDGPAYELANSVVQIEGSRMADALVRLIFIHLDNLFMRQSWWDSLREESKEFLKTMTRSGTTMRLRSPEEYSDDSINFIEANPVQVISG